MQRSLEDCIARYGAIEEGTWPDEARWCGLVPIPIGLHMINTASGMEAGHIYCNKDMAPALLGAFNSVLSRGLASELKTFDGCLMIRDVRGDPGKPSAHSYALAIDLNAHENPLGGPVKFSQNLLNCFRDAGFSLGANFHRVDAMHFSFGNWE